MGLNRSKNITAARTTADKWFGKYIRLRDSDSEGYVECVTCGEKLKDNEGRVDASHWIEKNIDITRYNEYNAHASCKRCNLSENGMAFIHGEAVKLLHGEDVYYELIAEAMADADFKYTKEEVMEIARSYKTKYEELLEIRNGKR